jgi:hypothetical protein
MDNVYARKSSNNIEKSILDFSISYPCHEYRKHDINCWEGLRHYFWNH